MAKEQPQGASLNPDTFSEGGGLLDDKDVTFQQLIFEMCDYNGTVSPPAPALKITMQPTEDGEEAVDQFFSAGNAKDWEPSRDGSRLVPVGAAKAFNKSSNLAILLRSIVDAGFPTDRLEDDCSVFEGMVCHVSRKAAPKRSGINRTPRKDGREYDPTNLIVDKIIKLPWEDAGEENGGDADAGSSSDAGLAEQAEEVLMEILADEKLMEKYKGKLTKKQITTAVFKAVSKDPNKKELMKLFISDEFLGDEEHPWTFDAKKGTIAIE